ncbi:2-C-methyl-D-erythritol 2,4-cyclodiphosphate synthase, chloroplastic [Porphyridium purpureum]|uniref:2-C-methyl-D-erythritol 2,4-cyclodiphosphate synthase n=1 Tax=Porphyridium purpureum TaxID=35688 RepID=A0A5J4Z043_PORPP|nr:2-C-methyl-D-erythritol 2,4-cyclodiphosphate synthase, chloroplastic [Porphyridium purpureum]|eukprot:POR9895..scf208_2
MRHTDKAREQLPSAAQPVSSMASRRETCGSSMPHERIHGVPRGVLFVTAGFAAEGVRSAFAPTRARLAGNKAGFRAKPAFRRRVRMSTAATDWAQVKPNEAEVFDTAPANGAGGIRIGHGYDLHRLEPGYDLILGGVKLEHDRGCCGHSDGDAVLHCVTDAVLGALSLPDIGQLFSDKDPRWKGAPSDVFVREARKRMVALGYQVSNIDVTIILERPKLSPHKAQIRKNIADLLQCALHCVNIKAKTHEKVDAVGENRAVEVHAVAILGPITATQDPAPTHVAELQLAEERVNQPHVLENLYETVCSRKGADPDSSWTAKLFAKGRSKIAQKVGEEATEVVIDAVANRSENVIKESADLLYHLSVLWADMGITPDQVFSELERREGTSGISEKASRK